MPPKKTPVLTKTGVPQKPRRTKAQIAAHLTLCGQAVKSKQTRAELKQSLLAAEERERAATKDTSGHHPTPAASKESSSGLKSKSKSNSKSLVIPSKADEIETPNSSSNSGPAFQLANWQHVVSALSQPKYREAIFGGGRRTNVTGLPMGSMSVLKPLALEINEAYNKRNHIFSRSRSTPNGLPMSLTGKTLKQHLTRYKARYQEVKAIIKGTGAGVSEQDLAKHGSLQASHRTALTQQVNQVPLSTPASSHLTTSTQQFSQFDQFNQLPLSTPASSHLTASTQQFDQLPLSTPASAHLTAYNQPLTLEQQLQDDLYYYPTRNGPDTALYPNGQAPVTTTALYPNGQAPVTTYFPNLQTTAYDPTSTISNATITSMIDTFPADYNFPPLPPPIEPRADYHIDAYMIGIPGNFSPTTFNNNNNNNDITATSLIPANIDPIPALEFNSESEGTVTPKAKKSKTVANIDPIEIEIDSKAEDASRNGKIPKGKKSKKNHCESETEEVIEKQPASTTQKSSKKKHCMRKSDSLTARERALDSSTSDDDSEILGPSKKRVKQTSRKSTGPITTIASRPMQPLPPIDSLAVRAKDIKNPIALALITSSADRNKEVQANNLYRRNLEETKQKEAAAAEEKKSQEAVAALEWEKVKLHKQGKQALTAERSRFARNLILAGKTPQELSEYLAAVFPPSAGSRSPSPSGPPVPSVAILQNLPDIKLK
ncbi:uncharacterized protein MELLADRAFT_110675 [Melampsora larici-populina 98AG31]|uniref:Uncharacterized protein n=1 Tax=Melampsora larici-populina (strain 98AG31 / pathotype 3-4-7) TaxID=747676 RepID=F4S0K8_MELLP|nr:uncharacterized protein MELLADRAFT_110675 [Melampsora larici-populina 98AG31]EGG01782.1 hypothetical protein MELLADRAFT_110675 [Melampsora larici-populina 98AG31]